MISAHDKSGPAFPCPSTCHHDGMTLRDWFAGQVLSEALSQTRVEMTTLRAMQVATQAYIVADAMLRVRDK